MIGMEDATNDRDTAALLAENAALLDRIWDLENERDDLQSAADDFESLASAWAYNAGVPRPEAIASLFAELGLFDRETAYNLILTTIAMKGLPR